jgi:hypothetical protein
MDGVFNLAQTFTVGVDGEFSGIAVGLISPVPVTLNVLQTIAGVPTFSVLASAVTTPTSFKFAYAGAHIFRFCRKPSRRDGGRSPGIYAFGFHKRWADPAAEISFGGADAYLGGELFYFTAGSTWQTLASLEGGSPTSADAAFETFVSVAEPALGMTFAIAALALLMASAGRKAGSDRPLKAMKRTL